MSGAPGPGHHRAPVRIAQGAGRTGQSARPLREQRHRARRGWSHCGRAPGLLQRPGLQLETADFGAFLRVVEDAEHVVGAPLPFSLPDQDDAPFLEVAIAGAVDAIVTDTAQHFRVRGGQLAIPVPWPSDFLHRMG
jgi:hypothetical protein